MINDEFVFEALLTELKKPIYRNGVVVDGFPRTETQVEYLNQFHKNQSTSYLAPRLLFVMLHVDEATSIARQQARGIKAMLQNKNTITTVGEKVNIRQTDIDASASKARYEVFKEQYEAVMTLGNTFPLIVVDAGAEPETVKLNIAKRMASLPSVLL